MLSTLLGWDPPGTPLGPPWDPPGTPLGPPWDPPGTPLGPPWDPPGTSPWDPPETLLGPSWDRPGTCLGPPLDRLRPGTPLKTPLDLCTSNRQAFLDPPPPPPWDPPQTPLTISPKNSLGFGQKSRKRETTQSRRFQYSKIAFLTGTGPILGSPSFGVFLEANFPFQRGGRSLRLGGVSEDILPLKLKNTTPLDQN